MNRIIISLLICVVLALSSCRKDVQAPKSPESYSASSFSEVFDAFWNGMNANYVYWDIDTTNWDNMYAIYRPLFTSLDIHNTNDVEKSVQYFRQMTSGLIDSHYTLQFNPPIADSLVIPSLERKSRDGALRSRYVFYNFDADIYLDSGYVSGTDTVNMLDGNSTEMITGTIANNVLYIGFNQFNLRNSYKAGNNGVAEALQFFFNYIHQPPSDFKGIIVDLRGNGGGDVNDLNFFIGNLIGNKLTIGSSRYKNGNGRLDYTPWVPAIVTPQAGATAIGVPIVAITDIWSTSMAELTAMAIRALPSGHVVGERTWGATGPLTSNEILNGGQFNAAGFVKVSTSSAMFRYIDGKMYEGTGFPPDYIVPFSDVSFQNSRDTQLEKALSLLK